MTLARVCITIDKKLWGKTLEEKMNAIEQGLLHEKTNPVSLVEEEE